MKIIKRETKKTTLSKLNLGTAFQFTDSPDYIEWSPSLGENADFLHALFNADSIFMLIEQQNKRDDDIAIVVDLESGLPYLIKEASITTVKLPNVEPFLTVD